MYIHQNSYNKTDSKKKGHKSTIIVGDFYTVSGIEITQTKAHA